MNIWHRMKLFWKDYTTASYNPKTKKIKAKVKLFRLHEEGHKKWDDLGLNNVADEIYLFWLRATLIYFIILGIEELFAWIHAFTNLDHSHKAETAVRRRIDKHGK